MIFAEVFDTWYRVLKSWNLPRCHQQLSISPTPTAIDEWPLSEQTPRPDRRPPDSMPRTLSTECLLRRIISYIILASTLVCEIMCDSVVNNKLQVVIVVVQWLFDIESIFESIPEIYTVNHKKRWQYICDHNSGKSWWILITFTCLETLSLNKLFTFLFMA